MQLHTYFANLIFWIYYMCRIRTWRTQFGYLRWQLFIATLSSYDKNKSLTYNSSPENRFTSLFIDIQQYI